MRLRNYSYKAQMHVYLIQSPKEMHMNSDVLGLSNTNHLPKTQSCVKIMMWQACQLIT
jgi:hypothetical protein